MFKNLTFYKLACEIDLAKVEEALHAQTFVECSAISGTQESSIGFLPPRGVEHGAMIELVNGQWIIKVVHETKSVPASAINREYEVQAENFEADMGRKPGKKESREMKEDIRASLIPSAFPKQIVVMVWIDPVARMVAFDSTSSSRLDAVLTLLVQTIEGFTTNPYDLNHSPQFVMATALETDDGLPEEFNIDRECELKATDESNSVVKYSKHVLTSPEVRQHIKQGKMPTRLALTYLDRISFVLTDNFQLKKIGFLDVVFGDQVGDKQDDVFDTDVTIATTELSTLIKALLELHEGERNDDSDEDEL